MPLVFCEASYLRAGDGDWVLRPGHFAERHGLIIIVALGEVIVALGKAVVDRADGGGFETTSIIALASTGVFAGGLWWSYFDRFQPAMEHHAEGIEGRDRGRFALDAYTYAHLPIVAGVILMAAALEEATLNPDQPIPLALRMMLLAGIATFVGGVSIGTYRAFRVLPGERLIGVAVLGAFVLLAGSVDGVWVIVIVDLVALVGLLAEHARIEVQPKRSPAN
ncbi:hypothetical protein BH24ACT5_BH24ACT5_04820 [soil metagenome]